MQLFLYRSFPQPRVHLRVLSHRFIFSGRFSKFVALRNYFERPASSRILTFSVSFSPFIVLPSFLNRASLVLPSSSLFGRAWVYLEKFFEIRSLLRSRNYFGPFPYFMPCLFLSLFLSSSFLLRFISLSALLSQTPLTWCSPYRCGNSRLDCV